MKYLSFPLVFFLLLGTAAALQTPSAQLIPSNISANSSFLMTVDMGITTDSVRVMWSTPGIMFGVGSVPKSGSKYICYFSSTDEASTCGPGPFAEKATWQMNINAINQNSETSNVSISVPVGGTKLIQRIDMINNTIYIRVSPSGSPPDSVSYIVYNSNLSIIQYETAMQYEIETGRYTASKTLNPGVYYIVFRASSASDFGGGVQRVEIPSAQQQAGQSCTNATGSSIPGITADRAKLSVLIKPRDIYQKTNLRISNTLNTTLTDLSVKPIENISDYMQISLQKTELLPNETTYYTVKLFNITTAMGLNADFEVWNGSNILGYISANISVSVIGTATSTVVAANMLDISPDPVISESSINSITKQFTLTNRGTTAITNVTHTEAGLESVATVSVPDSISAGGTAKVSVTLSPSVSGGRYAGTINIDTSAGSKQILVSVAFYKDITQDIESKITEADDLINRTPSSLISTAESVKTDLESAKVYFNAGNYESAEKEYSAAIAKLSILSDIAGSAGSGYIPSSSSGSSIQQTVDFSGIIIVVVILVIAVGGFLFLKKRRKKSAEEEETVEEI